MNNDSPAESVTHAIAAPVQEAEINDWLRLRHCKGLGNVSARKLIRHFGQVNRIFPANKSQLLHAGLTHDQAQSLLCVQEDDFAADKSWLEAPEHHIIPVTDPRYPAQIRSLDDAPPVLYVRGDPDYMSQPQLAMVGSRNPTASGRNTARDFAHHLAESGITITSGLASGIDGASHEGALKGLAGTVAIVAHGLDIIYPAEHQNLANQISQHGAVVSEMPIGTVPSRGLFPRRNRLISAISLGTLVVEAARNSGSLITARYALEQNREVFAIPGSIHNPLARGCHQLIRQGAKLVETAEDILEELPRLLNNYDSEAPRKTSMYPQKASSTTQENLPESAQALDPDYQKLLKCLAHDPVSIDELVIASGFSVAEIASMLLILELDGTITSQDGRYSRIK
jgi:DNA processing protein